MTGLVPASCSQGLGQGCEFVIHLPLMIQECRKIVEFEFMVQREETHTSGHRLLVVDDNKDAANSLAMLLRLQGHEVRVVYDGAAALNVASMFRPALIFLDLGMPKLDGYEVARRIRATFGLEETVLAALTGWGQQEDRHRTAEAGFNYHLVKPPEPDAIERIVALLSKSQ